MAVDVQVQRAAEALDQGHGAGFRGRIIGARTAAQLTDNLGCLEVRITPETMGMLDELSPSPSTYPETLLIGEFFKAMMYGSVRERVDWPE